MEMESKIEKSLRFGDKMVLESRSPVSRYAVAFEDDGGTGYFYALDTTGNNQSILDALHIYDVASALGKPSPSKLQIIWSTDGLKSALLINGHPHAVFDFLARSGCCRNNFPPPRGEWSKNGHAWDENALKPFK